MPRTTAPPSDPMSTEQILDTLRGLVNTAHSAKDGETVANNAVAAVHLFHILDVMLVNGSPIPAAWRIYE